VAGIDVGIYAHVDHVQAVGLQGSTESRFKFPQRMDL